MGRNYYMVRAMDSTELYFKLFFDNSIVGVGWSDVDFTKYADSTELRHEVYQSYYADSNRPTQADSRNLNEVERFKNINTGDYILIPYYSGIALAVAEGKELYDAEAKDIDLANQRAVQYRYKDGSLLVIPRNELSEGLQRRLRVPGSSVSNLYDFRDEIERLFSEESYSYSKTLQKKETDHLESLRRGLLDRIQSGNTNLQTGGIGLEHLVCELMCIEGYTAKVLPKSKFSGHADADIEALKNDAFSSTKIFVQVKHHSGTSPRSGIQQVIDVLCQTEYEEYDGWFVTSADVSADDLTFAKEYGIRVMEGHDLVDLIISDISRLSDATRIKLGISKYPSLLDV